MHTIYYLFLVTFLGFPFIGIGLVNYFRLDWFFKQKQLIIAFFVIYDLLFWFSVSLKGDFADYIIFAVEYLTICLFLFSPKKHTELWIKTVRVIGLTGICFGIIIGFIGIFLFPIISQDYIADRTYRFQSSDKSYETRRYSFGTISSIDTRYTFNTYRTFNILPFEYQIDKTDIFDSETNLNINEPNLKIEINKINKENKIKFSSTNGKQFTKSIR